MADVAEELAEAEASVDARKVHRLVDLDVSAHQRYPALDALCDQLPASIVQIIVVRRERALRLRGDAQSLGKVPRIVDRMSMGRTHTQHPGPFCTAGTEPERAYFIRTTYPVTSSSH